MRRLGLVLACLVAIGVPLMLGGGAALAASGNGCPGGAGDSQYVDPLGCNNTTSTSNSQPPTQSTPSSPPPTTTPTAPVTVANAATTTTSSGGKAHDPHGSLPHTGLDIWAAVALGVGLLAAGVAIRRLLPLSD